MTTDEITESVQPLSDHDAGETYVTPAAPPSVMPTHVPHKRRWKRLVLLSLAGVVVIIAAIVGIPRAIYAWNHVSTDDAIVNGHVTYIASRVSGLAQQVLVDDNQFVTAGTKIILIDPTSYKLAVDQRAAELAKAKLAVAQEIAALNLARAQLTSVRAQVRSKIADLRGSWYLVASVGDFVKYEIASLQAGVAKLHQDQAALQLAQEEYDRVMKLGIQGVSEEQIQQRTSALAIAKAQVNSSMANIQETRALLGLPPDPEDPGHVPPTVAQTFNGTQYALSTFLGSFAQLGLNVDILSLPSLTQLKDRFTALDVEEVIENSPSVKAAEAQVAAAKAALGGDKFDPADPDNQPDIIQAQKALDQANLQLSYTEIDAPISGYINRRSVNPGTLVTIGQPLLTIRPLADVWIDANFKETQLADLRIGQKVEIYVDAYPDKVFQGRIAGFSPGTGAVTSLLPPENATGNFVKVVQRLPVRIELTEPNPPDTPLFAGLSVDPEVDMRSQPQGPNAGLRLQTAAPSTNANGAAVGFSQ